MIKGIGNNGINSTNIGNSYSVKSGDTLSDIAKQKGVGLNELIKANPQINDPNKIFPGQQINIPSTNPGGNFDGLRVKKASTGNERPQTGLLQQGSQGQAVSQLQKSLADKGFNPGQIDGDFGPKTETALKAFQKSRGLEVDGILGPQSRDALSKTPNQLPKARPSQPDNSPDARPVRPSTAKTPDTAKTPNTTKTSNTPASKGNGSVSYNGKRVSDPALRNKLEQVADFFGRNITVTSGDRDFVPKGGSRTSLHLEHRAVDLHVQGLSDAEVFSKLKSSGILDRGFEVIRHGPNTATGGPHIHIGRYGDNRPSQFKLEGVPGRAGSGQYVRV